MRQHEDLLIDVLLDHGFTLSEAKNLIVLQERIERERRDEERKRGSKEWGSRSRPDGRQDTFN